MKINITSGRSDILFYTLTAAVVIVYVLINRHIGISFPTPWPDEAHFLWQAHAISTHNTLFAPELNTERSIMWMPPGYMFLTGLYFKVTGTSLEAARFLSLIAMVAFFVLIVRFLANYENRWYALALASLFFCNARFIACGNIARMEALLLLAIAGAFLLIQQGRMLFGLVILGLAPLLHFNGFYFAVAGLAFAFYLTPRKNWIALLNRRSFLAALVISAGWIAYGFLVHANWDSFVNDMAFQFSRKSERNVWLVITSGHYLIAFWAIILGGIYAYRSRLRAFDLLFLAVPAWLIWPIGHELWYEVIDHVGFLFISVFVIHLWLHLVRINKIVTRQWMQISLIVLFSVGLLWWNYDGRRIDNIFDYSDKAELVSMKVLPEVPYLTSDDRDRLSEVLISLSHEHNGLTVEFEPLADAFSYIGLEKEGVQFICPVFQERKPDILVVHLSRNLPTRWQFSKLALKRAGLTKDLAEHVWYSRDDTEVWFIALLSERIRAEEYNRTKIK